MSHHAEILAFRSKLEEIRKPGGRQVCACGTIILDYRPERRLGRMVHGALVCFREQEESHE